MAAPEETARFRSTLAAIAPGTALRDGLERILRGRTGALLVLGYDKTVESICSGGFVLDVDFSATAAARAREDGRRRSCSTADATRILRAAVHMVPDPSIPTERVRHPPPHRRAGRERRPAARSSRSASRCTSSRSTSTARRYVLEESGDDPVARQPGDRDARALQDAARRGRRARCPRSRSRTSSPSATSPSSRSGSRWSAASPREIAGLRARARHRRPAALAAARRARRRRRHRPRAGRARLPADVGGRKSRIVAAVLERARRASRHRPARHHRRRQGVRLRGDPRAARRPAQPARLPPDRSKVPRLPAPVVDRLVDHFGSLQKLLAASVDDLQAVEGVGEARARTVREGLSRLAESSILERYV